MSPVVAAAAFVRGAGHSTAAEPWKAAVRPPTYIGITYPPAHRRQFLSVPSTPPPVAALRRRHLAVSSLTSHDPRSRRFLPVAPYSAEMALRREGGAYSSWFATSQPEIYLGGGRRPGVRSGSSLLPLRCAPDTPSALLPEALPPNESPSKWRVVVNRFWAEVKIHGFSWAVLVGSLFAGYLATKNHGTATTLLNLREKGEKVYKFASHFIPLVISIIKCFW